MLGLTRDRLIRAGLAGILLFVALFYFVFLAEGLDGVSIGIAIATLGALATILTIRAPSSHADPLTRSTTSGEPSMTPDHLARERQRLAERWELLTTKLTGLESQYDHETRVEEKFRIKALIDDTRAERDGVEAQMATHQPPPSSSGTPAPPLTSRSGQRNEVDGSVRSKRDILFGDRSEGASPPPSTTDRDTRIKGDVEADGDITFGNYHRDDRRR